MMAANNYLKKEKVLELVGQKIDAISKTGFGEVKIVIRNGAVYRILSTQDELLQK